MTTEDINKMDEVKFIRFPSKRETLNNIRYLLSASTLILGIILLYGLATHKIMGSFESYFSLIIILLSGWAFASKSYEDIDRPFRELVHAYNTESDHHRTYVILIRHMILTVFWAIGLVSGVLFLAIVLFVFLKIPPPQ